MESLHSNIYSVLNHASIEQYESGVVWYEEARDHAKYISQQTGVPFITVCSIIAALSPMSPWERNKLDAYELCNGNTEHKCTTFGANVAKAYRLLDMVDYSAIVDELNGLKTVAFFDNIFNPDSMSVTIDSHMLSLAYGRKLSKAERPSLTDFKYHTIADGIKKLADENNLRPYELQAILWVTWREV